MSAVQQYRTYFGRFREQIRTSWRRPTASKVWNLHAFMPRVLNRSPSHWPVIQGSGLELLDFLRKKRQLYENRLQMKSNEVIWNDVIWNRIIKLEFGLFGLIGFFDLFALWGWRESSNKDRKIRKRAWKGVVWNLFQVKNDVLIIFFSISKLVHNFEAQIWTQFIWMFLLYFQSFPQTRWCQLKISLLLVRPVRQWPLFGAWYALIFNQKMAISKMEQKKK